MAVQIKDDEIFELLERLAATEDMFKTPVSTIRDVAELTEASPNLIARILGEMRGTNEFEELIDRLKGHEWRISRTEADVAALKAEPQGKLFTNGHPLDTRVGAIFSLFVVLGLAFFIIYWFFVGTAKSSIGIGQSSSERQVKYSTSDGNGKFNVYSDGTIVKVVNGSDVDPSAAEREEVQKRYQFAEAMGDIK